MSVMTEIYESPVKEAERLVSEEAERLDRLQPNWSSKINLDEFDLWSPHCCVLGQVYGDFDEAFDMVRNDGYESRCVYSDANKYESFWRVEIKNRQES